MGKHEKNKKQELSIDNLRRALYFTIGFEVFWIAIYILSDFLDSDTMLHSLWIYPTALFIGSIGAYQKDDNDYLLDFGLVGFCICGLTICYRIIAVI